jgi:hypothetical protein
MFNTSIQARQYVQGISIARVRIEASRDVEETEQTAGLDKGMSKTTRS